MGFSPYTFPENGRVGGISHRDNTKIASHERKRNGWTLTRVGSIPLGMNTATHVSVGLPTAGFVWGVLSSHCGLAPLWLATLVLSLTGYVPRCGGPGGAGYLWRRSLRSLCHRLYTDGLLAHIHFPENGFFCVDCVDSVAGQAGGSQCVGAVLRRRTACLTGPLGSSGGVCG